MAAGSIVKDFDVIKDVGACELARFVDPVAYAFLVQATEEGLGDALTLLCQVLQTESARSAKINGYSSRTM